MGGKSRRHNEIRSRVVEDPVYSHLAKGLKTEDVIMVEEFLDKFIGPFAAALDAFEAAMADPTKRAEMERELKERFGGPDGE